MASEKGANAVVHVVDDDAATCAALESLFETVGLTTKAYGTARDFLATKLSGGPGCVVIDIRLPDMSGLEFQAQLAHMGVRLPVIMITGHGDVPMSVRAMKGGALDFLQKPFRDQDMLDAVLTAIARDRQRIAAESGISQLRQKFETLSSREREVMFLVTAGKLNKQVAGELGISEMTVKIHRGAAMRKMGVKTLADLVRISEALKANAP